MLLLIVGRTASGKDTAARILEERHGLKQLKSYTDRPRREGEGDTHIFVDTENLPTKDVIAKTNIGGHTYLATKDQFDEADTYVIDPAGIDDLAKRLEKTSVALLYIHSLDGCRAKRFCKRSGLPEDDAMVAFIDRELAEKGQFKAFEALFGQSDLPKPLVQRGYYLSNDEGPDELVEALDAMVKDLKRRPPANVDVSRLESEDTPHPLQTGQG